MATPTLSRDRPIKEIWQELAQTENYPEAPYCQKLTLLAQLKTAAAVASCTRWLMVLTYIIALCTAVQAVVAVLAYLHSPVH
jgi:hypothetical protein